MTGDAASVARFVDLFASRPTAALIANLTTRVEALNLGGLIVPMTVNDGDLPGNCYICDPVAGYTDYAIDETRNFVSRPALQAALVGLVRAVAPIVRATGLDRAVHVNNWLFSTNPAMAVDAALAARIRDDLVARFPDHAIILRSLNTAVDGASIAALRAEGYLLFPSRQVYLFDGRDPPSPGVDFKRDRRLLETTPYRTVGNSGFTTQDHRRCATLYDMLYLDKYTPLNPQYTADFIAEMQRRGLIELEGFRDETGRIVAFGGRFRLGDTLTQPLLGYDTSLPQKAGLYRLITALAQRTAIEQGLIFNMSAGAAGFKRHRGARPAIEYSAIYARHLSTKRRAALRVMQSVLTGVGVPLLKRFEL